MRPSRKRSYLAGCKHTGRQRTSRSGCAQADEQRVGEVDDIRQRLVAEPVQQLVELLPEDALTPFEHRDHQVAEELPDRSKSERLANARMTRGESHHLSEEAGCVPEQREVLLKVKC
jgi:hypothetical protein